MDASVVLPHGVGHAGRVVAALHRTLVGRALVVGLHVLPQVVLVLEAGGDGEEQRLDDGESVYSVNWEDEKSPETWSS